MMSLVGELGTQLRQSFGAGAKGVEYRSIRSVEVSGMGGSAAAADLLAGVVDPAEMQIRVHRGYSPSVPPPDGSLQVFSSYSGNTEETLAAFEASVRAGAGRARVVIGSGGRLLERAAEESVPIVRIPAGLPPRASLGHGVGALAAVLSRVGDTGLAEQIEVASETLDEGRARWGLEGGPARDGLLEDLADRIADHWPLIWAGAPLTYAVTRRWKAQLNENAKLLASIGELPELDHNEIEGFSRPTVSRDRAFVIAVRDLSEHPRNALRFSSTRATLEPLVAGWTEIHPASGPPLARMLSLVQQGDVLSCLLARNAGIDPVPVHLIDQLKRRLADS
jgi:glucose/mannose-6-phosphate isomerase